ncbi:MAG: hypothetical protein BZ135_00205 [Methanosphaera sp. rholeuAM6]|nr:MAG: hypothetical protein BZ135_00205 [Methanosphaera sp. rholeuAM6]
MNNETENNSQETTLNEKHPIIVLSNQHITEKIDKKEDTINYSIKKDSHILFYLATTVLTILLYSYCAFASNVALIEIIDLELPLAILFTLILTECSIQGYSKISYVIYVVLSCILYMINPTYAFFFVIALISNLITKSIEKIYFNKNDFRFSDDFSSKTIFKKHILRVKYHLFLSFVLFVIFLLLGYFYPTVFQSLVLPTIQGMSEGVQNGTVKLETVPLFINNFSVALNMIYGGFLLSTATTYSLIFNALVVGVTACTMDLGYFLSYTLPHGIFELTAIIIAGAAGFRVSESILTIFSGIKLNCDNKGEIFAKHVEIGYKMLFDVLIMLVIIIVLLIIAAYIEANLTIPLGQTLMNNVI